MAGPEGVIKFDLQFRQSSLEKSAALDELLQWRDAFYRLGAIGRDAARYHGNAFGNLSCRLGAGDAFLVSGSRTGGYAHALPEHFTCVDSFDVEKNRVVAYGPVAPSSESLTHGAVYALNGGIHCVVHGHLPAIWNKVEALSIPTTPADVAYGTPDMAQAIARLYRQAGQPGQALFAMLGHEDGIIAYGPGFAPVEALMRDMAQKAANT